MNEQLEANKAIVREYYDLAFNQKKPEEAVAKYMGPYDGMSELWFDDVESLLAARTTPEWRASTEDESNFIEASRTAYFISVEHDIV